MYEKDPKSFFAQTKHGSKPLHSTAHRFKITALQIAAIVCIGIGTIAAPILLRGWSTGGDFAQHLRFAVSYSESWENGKPLPDWTNDNFGFGSIGVRLYPPVSALTAALIHRAVGNWYTAFTISLLGWMVVGCVGTFLFLREFVTAPLALGGAVIFAIAPHHLVLVFKYFFYAEFVALSILPFCALFLARVLRRGAGFDITLLSISYSILFLSHIPLTLIATLALAIYALGAVKRRAMGRVFFRIAAAAILSVAATSFYWIKLVWEGSWLRHTFDTFWADFFSFHNWFFPSYRLVSHLSPRVALAQDLDAVLTLAIAVPALLYLVLAFKRSRTRIYRHVLGLVFSAGVCFYLASRASYFIWSNVSVLQNLQFPFRFLTPLAFLGAAAQSIALQQALRKRSSFKKLFIVIALFSVFGILAFDLRYFSRPDGTTVREHFDQVVSNMDSHPVPEWWWPVWARSTAFDNKQRVTTSGRDLSIKVWEREVREFTVAEGKGDSIRIATFYYPFWRGEVNGVPAEVSPDDQGVIVLAVPAEASAVRIYFHEPMLYTVAEWISITVLCLMGIVTTIFYLTDKKAFPGRIKV